MYWEDDTKPETMGKVRVPWNHTSVTVSVLAGHTQYFLTVSAFNTAGTGPFLPAINVTTKKPRKSSRHPAALLLHFVYTRMIISRYKRWRVLSSLSLWLGFLMFSAMSGKTKSITQCRYILFPVQERLTLYSAIRKVSDLAKMSPPSPVPCWLALTLEDFHLFTSALTFLCRVTLLQLSWFCGLIICGSLFIYIAQVSHE